MGSETQAATGFYATSRGAVAARILRRRLERLWPDMAGKSVLGLGYTAPYLRLWRGAAARCVAATPAQTRLARWPLGLPNLSCAVEEDALPFPDLSFDRVLLVHGLEAAENARRVLREVWRVLKDDGSLLVVAPNRSGMWAHVESTPFGHGRPYSSRQIDSLLAQTLFRVERRDTALYVPPANWRGLLRGAPVWEATGRRIAPGFAGLLLSEAVKDVYGAVPIQAGQRRVALARRLILAEPA